MTRSVVPGVPLPRRVHARTRLFARLDAGDGARLVWVHGSAGSGKTTLVASWLGARGLAALWHRLERDDVDPHHLLGRLADAAGLSPERRSSFASQPDPQAATRALLRELAADPVDRTIVLDEHECLPDDAPVQRVLVDAVSTMPEGWTLVVIGRAPPPAPFARLRASQACVEIDGTALRLDGEETRAIAALHADRTLSEEEQSAIAELGHGWTAGVALLAGATKLPTAAPRDSAVPQVVFDYFAEEILAGLSEGVRHGLESLSVAPLVTDGIAAALTGDGEAIGRLAALAERSFFVDVVGSAERRGPPRSSPSRDAPPAAPDTAFRLHPLLRDTLRRRLERRLGPDGTRESLSTAADRMLEESMHGAAFALYVEAGRHERAAEIVLERAPILLAELRPRALLDRIDSLPTALVERSARLSLWHGVAAIAYRPRTARERLERAWSLLLDDEDGDGALLCCCAAIDSFIMVLDDFHGMDPWIERLESRLDTLSAVRDPALEARVATAMLAGHLYRRADDERFERWRERGLELLSCEIEPFVFIMLAQFSFYAAIWTRSLAQSAIVLERTRRRVFESERTDALQETLYRTLETLYFWNRGELAEARESSRLGLERAEEAGAHAMDVLLHYHAGIACLMEDDLAAARTYLERVDALTVPDQLMNVVSCHQLRGMLDWRLGDLAHAREHLAHAVEQAERAGLAFAEGYERCGLALVELESGETDRARRTLLGADELARRFGLSYVRLEVELVRARFALLDGDRPRARRSLAAGLALARGSDRLASSWWTPRTLAPLCAEALDAEIEPEHVRRMIRANGILPPGDGPRPERWPWRLRLRLLGEPSIEVDGRALRPAGKSPAKPLELLHALATLGGSVPMATLADALWPGAEGDAALASLKTTLARLRRLIDVDGLFVVHGGRLALDPALCWSDIGAIVAAPDRREDEPLVSLPGEGDGSDRSSDARETGEVGARRHPSSADEIVVRLHRGDLLPDLDAEWTLAPRERLRARYRQAVLRVGDGLERQEAYREAIELYETALERGPPSDTLYRRVMLCHLTAGRPDEGLLVYERCCEALVRRLGRVPSGATERVRHRLVVAATIDG